MVHGAPGALPGYILRNGVQIGFLTQNFAKILLNCFNLLDFPIHSGHGEATKSCVNESAL